MDIPLANLWLKPEVARAQLVQAKKALAHPEHCEPFQQFIWAMGQMRGRTLLDVGCGVGHYGVLCQREFPKLQYTGTDWSDAMIAEARGLCPTATFAVLPWDENRFENHDIVYLSQVLEYTSDPLGALRYVLRHMKHYVILNRVMVQAEGEWKVAEAYGEPCRNYWWGERELEGLWVGLNTVTRRWGNCLTVAVER